MPLWCDAELLAALLRGDDAVALSSLNRFTVAWTILEFALLSWGSTAIKKPLLLLRAALRSP
jgi:hypothetical protein